MDRLEKLPTYGLSGVVESKRVTWAFLISSLTRTPFWALFGMVQFILYKELHASPWMITLFITLKPAVAIFSMYWGAHIFERSDRLRSNIALAGLFSYLPFLLLPWIHSAWVLIICSGIFMFFLRGATPAWVECMKRSIPSGHRERIFAIGTNFSWLGGGVFPILIGYSLDNFREPWKSDFFLTASLALLGNLVVWWLIPNYPRDETLPPKASSEKNRVIAPWIDAWKLLFERRDFALFQFGFLFGGIGVMLMQPAIPIFLVDSLHLSYTELAIAFTLCKGLGYAVSSAFWANKLNSSCLFRLTALITLLSTFFPLLIICAVWNESWLFLAYLIYGIMQAGSEISWSLSGPIFSKEGDSSRFTSVNIMMVGIRGCMAPSIGALLFSELGAVPVLLIGGGICFVGSLVMLFGRRYVCAVGDVAVS